MVEMVVMQCDCGACGIGWEGGNCNSGYEFVDDSEVEVVGSGSWW